MKQLIGTITSLKNTNTATVLVESQWQHPVYKKYVKRSKKFACDTANFDTLAEGMKVEIGESRPLSKTKHFVITNIIDQGGSA